MKNLPAPFEQEALLASLGGNREVLVEMVKLCLEIDSPRLLGDLRAGLEKQDFATVEHAAHGISGLAGVLHASAARTAAMRLEKTAREHRADDLRAEGEALLREFERLSDALQKVLCE
jgi:HPt (histidine-containing phosphotransfer) domain-containing protein